MSPRKTLDIDPDIQAILAKAEKKRRDHQMMLGEIVIETGIHKELDADELRAVLIGARDKAIARRTRANAEAAAQGAAEGTFQAKPAAKAHGPAEPEPARPRHPDLLARPEQA